MPLLCEKTQPSNILIAFGINTIYGNCNGDKKNNVQELHQQLHASMRHRWWRWYFEIHTFFCLLLFSAVVVAKIGHTAKAILHIQLTRKPRKGLGQLRSMSASRLRKCAGMQSKQNIHMFIYSIHIQYTVYDSRFGNIRKTQTHITHCYIATSQTQSPAALFSASILSGKVIVSYSPLQWDWSHYRHFFGVVLHGIGFVTVAISIAIPPLLSVRHT